jgi:hypothetical protein
MAGNMKTFAITAVIVALSPLPAAGQSIGGPHKTISKPRFVVLQRVKNYYTMTDTFTT